MQPPLCHNLGFLAETTAANQILHGTYEVPNNVDKYTKKTIAELKMPDSIRNQSSTVNHITTKEHIQSWQKQKESTASDNVTGVSFSHYIAGTYDPHIAEFDTLIRSLPYQYGFSPKNWQTISDVEILKKLVNMTLKKWEPLP